MEILSSRTLIHPRDLERSLTFYGEQLGLAVAYEFGSGEQRGVVFFAGGGHIEVVGSAVGTAPLPGELALWLRVRDVVAAVEEAAARGVRVVRGAVEEPWGLVEAWLEDPDGLRIHLVEVPPNHPLRRDPRDPSQGAGT